MQSKVKMKLVGEDGNAYAILGRFKLAAKRQGWTDDQIKTVLDKAMSGDYNNLVATIASHIEEQE